jgi:amino acid transporter
MTAVTAISLFWIFHGNSGHWTTVDALLSAIPLVFLFVAIVRYTLRTDELDRKIVVESSAIAGGATALIALMYSFLEGAGYPKPHAMWAYFTFMISLVIASLFFRRRYK